MSNLFDEFTDPEELIFDRTVVPLRMAESASGSLVSRSQARRVAFRFERFKRVELDFDGIAQIGQGFADELFRVFAAAHPETQVTPVNASPAVARMIRRTAGSGGAGSEPARDEQDPV